MDPVSIVAYLIAIAIPAFTVYLFIALDVFGTGKPSTIFACVAWGAVGAYLLALTFNSFMFEVLDRDLVRGLTAPIGEELLKAIILVILIQQPRFRYIVDGAVYGIAVGIGFGLSENVFWYLPRAEEGALLGTAITRTLSTALMHGTASGLVGISLGRIRRSTGVRRVVWPVVGVALAWLLHIVYNNLVGELTGAALLLVAVGIGIGGGIVIAVQVVQGLAEEKKRFAESLGLEVDVSTGERKAVQRLGGAGIEEIFSTLHEIFGDDHIAQVRRLLVVQANMGILQNNLKTDVSDRLREAWQEEFDELQDESESIRRKLGPSVRLFLQSVFPSEDTAMQEAMNEELGEFDPTLVHTFDMFMRISELAESFTPEQLSAMADRLHQITIFQHVSPANLENLCRAIEVHDLEAGTTLFEQNDPGDAMYLVEAGEIEIFLRDTDGKPEPIRTFGPGNVVGEFALLDGQLRSAGAAAKTTTKALVLQREVFTMFIQSRPKVVLAMLRYLADKVRHTTNTVEASVASMSTIAQGNYAALAVQTNTTPPPSDKIALQPEEIAEDTSEVVAGVFSRAAADLQEREQSIRAGRA
ncbi:MAG: PrsW family intramembrane metalloprotease [Chloroflexi bacterium]|nr:PrsW family intramembrane metalloprotease [Chloroflexota bacterium]